MTPPHAILPPDVLSERWKAVKQVGLDAGWVVKFQARQECREDFLRHFLVRDLKAMRVGELRQNRTRGRSDAPLSAQAGGG